MDSRQPNLEEIFLETVQKDPAHRQAFLEKMCADSTVRARVEALLRAHDSAGDFLAGPAVQPAAMAETRMIHPRDGETTCFDESLDFLERCDTSGRLGVMAHYEILEILGRGGMGVVLRGVDVKLNRVVAMKVLAPQLAANPMARQRFLREAQAAAAVSHTHVVAIHAVDEFKGLPYLVMEFIAGSSLQHKIDTGGALPLAQILRIGAQIASGLAAAHAQGLVHRDIKPSNILLENGVERVKITDFGLARSVDDVRITQAGMVYGTPLYMSPEQAQGERIDQRSDLFSLGSVLYTMCTGRPPFRGDTGLAVLKRVCDDTPRPIREVNPGIPSALAAIVDKLLSKKPEARFQNAGEVADLLEQCLSELQRHGQMEAPGSIPSHLAKPTSAVPEPQRMRPQSKKRPFVGRRWLLAVAASLVLIAGFGLTEATGFTNVGGTVIRLFTPDGTLVVEVDDPGVSVRIDSGEIIITGAGAKEIRLKPGQHKLVTSKDGKPVRQELVTITKDGRQVVRVSREGQSVAIGNEPAGTPALEEKRPKAPAVATQDEHLAAPPLARAPFDAQQARECQKAWAKYEGVRVVTTNSLGMKFRLIPPGEFTMGVTDEEAEAWTKFHQDYQDGGKRAAPAHSVRLTRPFYLAESEVRYGDFLDLMKREPGGQPKHPHHDPDGVLQANCTWFDCIEFCNRLSQREGLTPAYKVDGEAVTVIPNATGYRLPTEAQWEFACRAGTTTLWYFGLTAQEARAMCDRSVQEGQKHLRDRIADPHPFGLLGMYAGASEWCWDWYDPGYYRQCADQGVAVDPQGPDSGEARITRGGSRYGIDSADLGSINSAARIPQHPRDKAAALAWNGFGRVVLPIPAKGQAASAPVKVYILAGDSNMAGRAKLSLMRYQASQPETKKLFEHLLRGDGRWVVREDVWIKNFSQMGNLTAGFGQSPDRFGPELEFGNVMGDHFDEQVLLIKTCWGGHNIFRDFRPPSSGLPPQEVLQQRLMDLQKEKPDVTLADVQQSYSATYRAMLKEIRETLANLDEHFPTYEGQGFEIAGFVWFSGWNDMLDFDPSYVELLAQFIRDVRRDLETPNLPFVIGQLGVNPDGVQPDANDAKIRDAQAEVAELPEFKDNVKLVPTDPFWDREAHAIEKLGLHEPREGWDKVGSDLGFHYLGSAKTFCAMGKAFGEGMIKLSRSGAKN